MPLRIWIVKTTGKGFLSTERGYLRSISEELVGMPFGKCRLLRGWLWLTAFQCHMKDYSFWWGWAGLGGLFRVGRSVLAIIAKTGINWSTAILKWIKMPRYSGAPTAFRGLCYHKKKIKKYFSDIFSSALGKIYFFSVCKITAFKCTFYLQAVLSFI